jgi:hypothetical protein
MQSPYGGFQIGFLHCPTIQASSSPPVDSFLFFHILHLALVTEDALLFPFLWGKEWFKAECFMACYGYDLHSIILSLGIIWTTSVFYSMA